METEINILDVYDLDLKEIIFFMFKFNSIFRSEKIISQILLLKALKRSDFEETEK